MTSRWAAHRPDDPRGPLLVGLEIRRAERADCPDVAALTHERDGVPVAAAHERCERDLVNANCLLLLATIDGELAGFGRAAWWQRPPQSTAEVAPDGWYLFGVVVRDRWRRRGIALELTRRRLEWIGRRADAAWYLANARNRASIDLHARLGFVEVTRDFTFPGVSFEGGVGILFRKDLVSVR